jgi:hypothetical protein
MFLMRANVVPGKFVLWVADSSCGTLSKHSTQCKRLHTPLHLKEIGKHVDERGWRHTLFVKVGEIQDLLGVQFVVHVCLCCQSFCRTIR